MDDKLLVSGGKDRASASRDRFNSSGIDLWEIPTGGIIPQSMTQRDNLVMTQGKVTFSTIPLPTSSPICEIPYDKLTIDHQSLS